MPPSHLNLADVYSTYVFLTKEFSIVPATLTKISLSLKTSYYIIYTKNYYSIISGL